MTIRTILIAAATCVLTSGASAAQQPGPGPAFTEQLREVRMQRMQEALGLDDEAARALRHEMERNREAHHRALEERRDAMLALQEALRGEDVSERDIARRLEALEEHHAALGRLEREHHQRLSEILTPSQRARFLVFSQRFDRRLREMIQRRFGDRSPGPGRDRPPGPLPRDAGPPGDLRGPATNDPAARADALQRRIERMERELERMRSELRGIESGE